MTITLRHKTGDRVRYRESLGLETILVDKGLGPNHVFTLRQYDHSIQGWETDVPGWYCSDYMVELACEALGAAPTATPTSTPCPRCGQPGTDTGDGTYRCHRLLLTGCDHTWSRSTSAWRLSA